MKITVEHDAYTPWQGAVDNYNKLDELDLLDLFWEYTENCFSDETPTETEINDYLWFDFDTILKDLLVQDYHEPVIIERVQNCAVGIQWFVATVNSEGFVYLHNIECQDVMEAYDLDSVTYEDLMTYVGDIDVDRMDIHDCIASFEKHNHDYPRDLLSVLEVAF